MLATTDKNLRPYMVSIDWLQIHVRIPADFNPFSQNLFGYHYRPIHHGTRTFRALFEVYEPDGVLLGILAVHPTSPVLNPLVALFKVDNAVLYEAEMVNRVFNYFSICNLRYRSITRLDICFDSNELYGGLKHQSLMENYFKREYLKIGLNKVWAGIDLRYSLSVNSKGYKNIFDNKDEKKRPLQNLPKVEIETITWGSRASDVQVQIYNKTKELKAVKMKHHIVNAWKAAGLDTERDVYRIEIRIARGGKQLKNTNNGSRFNLSLNEILNEQIIEQLFSDYAHKYFRFYRNKGMGRIQRMKEVRLFSLTQQHVVRPQRLTKKKDYSKMQKILINYLDKEIYSNKQLSTEVVKELEATKEYYLRAYNMETWYEEMKKERCAKLSGDESILTKDPDYYDVYLEGIDRTSADRAAQMQAELEEEARVLQELLEEEKRDFGDLYKRDILARL